MKNRINLISKLIIASNCIFFLSGCGKNERIESIVFDENYEEVWKVGEIDFSKLFFEVTHTNGVIEKVPVDASMINEKDLYKFYKVGDWKVKISYSETTYAIVDFTIVENEFSEDLKLKNEIIAYDGQSHGLSLEGPLPEGTNVYFPYGNSFSLYSQNPYQVKCIVSKEGYKTKELNGFLTITKSEYDKEILDSIVFEDAEYIYDGFEKKIVASNVPEDCTISYYIGETQGNGRVNVGEYVVTGVLKCSNLNYEPIPNITATLKIKKATYDFSGINFPDKTALYQKGVSHSILLENTYALPNGVTVNYDNNIHEDAGEYIAVAYFEGDSNHEPIAPMRAKLTITKQDIDLSGVQFEKSQTLTFNGEEQDFEVSAPDMIQVNKKYFDENGVELDGKPVNAGMYTVKCSFTLKPQYKSGNYNLLNAQKGDGILYIQKKVLNLSGFDFGKQTYVYDGNVHDFDVEYMIIDGKRVRTKLPEELQLEKTYIFNGREMINEKPKEVGNYIVNFNITLKDNLLESNYDIRNLPTESGRLTINKNTIDLSNIVLADQTVIYNEEVQQYFLGELPTDAVIPKIEYFEDGVLIPEDHIKDVGVYKVRVSFSLNEELYPDEHYELVNAKFNPVTFRISPMTVDFSNISVNNASVKASPSGVAFPTSSINNFSDIMKYVDPVFTYFYSNGGSQGAEFPKGESPTEPGLYFVQVTYQLKNGKSASNYKFLNNREAVVQLEVIE